MDVAFFVKDLAQRVERYNGMFPRYPKLCFDKGWLYGVWYCPRSFQKQVFYGQYPLTFLRRVRSLFGNLKPFVHLFSGVVVPEEGEITVDNDESLNPVHCCSADKLPFKDCSINCILADPPYSREDAKHYRHQEYPSMKDVFMESSRVLSDKGYLLFLHSHLLSIPKKSKLKLCGTVGVLTGTNAIIRVLAVYRKEV